MKKLSLLLGLFSFMLLLGVVNAATYTCPAESFKACSDCGYVIWDYGNGGNTIQLTNDIEPSYDSGSETWECEDANYGACFDGSSVTQSNFTLDCNGHRIFCSGSSCTGCSQAIYLRNWSNVIIKNCIIEGFPLSLYFGVGGNNITFYNTIFNTTGYMGNSTSITNIFFNTTRHTTTNIVNGSEIGGNFWAYPNGSGYSETCANNNNDSFCDSAYSFNPTDYLPLTYGGGGGDTTPPDISWNSPSNNSVTQNESYIYYNVTVSETGQCYLNINGSANYSMSISGNYCYLNRTGLSNSTLYIAQVYANDTSGNLNLSSERWVTINMTSFTDTTSPAITITSPTSTNYTTTTIALDVSTDEPTDAWWYSLNGGSNTTFTPNTTIAAAQGTNDLFVYANDTTGNIGEAGVSFFIDSITPDISWNSPTNNSVTQNSSFIFWNVTLSETGTCELDLNSSLNITMNVNGLYCSYDFAGTNTTTYCGKVYVSDIFGNMNLSSSMCETINLSGTDIVPPNLTINSPTGITYTTSDIALTVSANEPINTWWYNLNGGANTSFTPNTTISGMASGVYTLNIYASDLYGNEGFSSIIFTVQIPVISNLGFFAPIAGVAIGGGFLLFMLGLFLEEGAALARDPKKLATIAIGILIVAVLLSALFV